MSLINFLNPKLKPSVECDAICEDDHSATNLIADDAEQLSRGFMAYSLTKPPVDIIFEFPKAIDLKVIKLWNTYGSLRSTAFEIHGKCGGIWERVANVRELAKGVDSVTFCYQSEYNSRSSANIGYMQHSEKVFFFKSAHKILNNTNCIKITIRGTYKCAPVLRKVQVWGLPARSLDKADRELVKTIWNEITNPYGRQQQGQRSPSRNLPELDDDSTLEIPEEFLDAITWELMIFPTVLPSGKIVDQSTIDRHSEVEAKWGRLPSDPFTGLEFTAHRKAILDLALKARIEKFLMENADQFKTVPRCLGSSRVRRSKNRHASQFASIGQHYGRSSTHVSGTYSKLTLTSKATATFTSHSASTALNLSPPPAKRARVDAPASYADVLNLGVPATLANVAAAACTQTTATRTALRSDFSLSDMFPAATSVIETDLQKALMKITRFTCPLAEATKLDMCIGCGAEDFSYEIQTCKHLVCRKCLVSFTKEQMCKCKTSFCNADIERYHKI